MKSRWPTVWAAAFLIVAHALGGPPSELVVPAANAATPEPTPVRVPVGTLPPHPTEIVVQATNGATPLSAPSPASDANPSGTEKATQSGRNHSAGGTPAQIPEPAGADRIAILSRELADKQAEVDELKAREAKLLELIQRLERQQVQIEDNQIQINRRLSDATLQVKQAQFLSRRAIE